MSPGTAEFAQVVVVLVASLLTFSAIVIVDERRIGPERLARAWPAASRDAAILGVGLVGVPYAMTAVVVHFVRTRGWIRGLLVGVPWAAGILAVNLGALAVLDAIATPS